MIATKATVINRIQVVLNFKNAICRAINDVEKVWHLGGNK